VIIAHRLATVRRADEIVVLEHGRIVQRGGYRELMSEDGAFRRLAHQLVDDALPAA
jgi:ABC-type multidrug transport system fused ATPase/permease subunit